MLNFTKSQALPVFSLLALGVATVVSVASLKPSFNDTTTLTPIAVNIEPTIAPASANDTSANDPAEPTRLSDLLSPEEKTELDQISYQYAKTLNELLKDFFTTDFDIETQNKWQHQLALGTPFLSQLASYLKLDQLYGLDLYEAEAALIDQSYTLYNLDIQLPTFFKFLNHYAEDFWPMSIVAQAKSNSHTENLLLNHYDRNFVITIEQFQLASTLAPLAKGIERLLSFHLEQIALNGARISRYHLINDIQQVVQEFSVTVPDKIDVFIQYDLLLQQEWQLAVEHLLQSPLLNQPEYEFFFDLNALYASRVLIDQVQYSHFQTKREWWTQFLEFELCLNAAPNLQAEVAQRLSLANLCAFNQSMTVPNLTDLNARPLDMILTFWNRILVKNNLDRAYLDEYFQRTPPYSMAQLAVLNSHDILNGLAEANRLRIIRNQNTLKRAEKNYRIWQNYIGQRSQDSLFNYSTLFLWFHQTPEQYADSINENLPDELGNLGQALNGELAKEIISFISRGILNRQNINQYQPLLSLMSIDDQYTYEQFVELAQWPRLTNPVEIPKDYDLDKRRLKEKAHRMLLESTINQTARNAYNFDDFLINSKNYMKDFEITFAYSRTARSVANVFDENGKFHKTYLRELSKIWLKHNPETDTNSDYYDLL